ncbi:MAG: pseudouridine synthase family protein [Bacteriovoracaceae bacterium]
MASKSNQDKKTFLCFTQSYSSLDEALMRLGFSKQSLKKNLSKKQRTISVEAFQEKEVLFDVLNFGRINPEFIGPLPKIIFENEDFLILNKPSGVQCEARGYSDKENLLSYLRSIGRGSLLINHQQHLDRGLLNRLDGETSGLVLYSKKKVEKKKETLFKVLKKKVYLCLVQGEIKKRGVVKALFSHKGEKASQTIVVSEGGREGCLKIIQSFYLPDQDISLVCIELDTGIRHQIRAYMKALGHPIVGDSLYGAFDQDEILQLHAWRYELQKDVIEADPKNIQNLVGNFLDLDSCLDVFRNQLRVGE